MTWAYVLMPAVVLLAGGLALAAAYGSLAATLTAMRRFRA